MKKIKNKEKLNEEIPIEIKESFGKFFFYSIIMDLFIVMVICMVYKYLSFYFKIIVMLLILVIYLAMLRDLMKKRKHFMSSSLVISILITAIVYSLAVLKIFALA